MYLDNLAIALLRYCDAQSMSYEIAAELCNISARHFGSIVRRRTKPTVPTLERICTGLRVAPNDLLLPPDKLDGARQPMAVVRVRVYDWNTGHTGFPVCPACGSSLEREYQAYCDRCGQCLDWSRLGEAVMEVVR